MEMTMHLSRTVKGQEEIFNLGHTLRPRHRQILFSVGNGISFGELRSKLPNCENLESMVSDLLQNGFIQGLRNMTTGHASAPAIAPVVTAPAQAADLSVVQAYVLEFMAGLVGNKSPAYKKMSEVGDWTEFRNVLPMCQKVIAAVASPHQAAEMLAGVDQRMRG